MRKIFNSLLGFGMFALLATSCQDKMVYDPDAPKPNVDTAKVNMFDFSTAQLVNLNIDYSAYQTHGPVFFSVYGENPFEGTDAEATLRTDIKPIYENYTNAQGKFSGKVKLPAYAEQLYIFTGNFFVMDQLITAPVLNGIASATAENFGSSTRGALAMPKAGAATNSLETLYMLSYEVDVNTGDKVNNQIYKEWQTPLGKWDSESGRPLYLLDKATADPDLVFSDAELEGLYQTISNALVANQTCNEIYVKQADLTLEKESEVAITFLGGVTCWNDAMGYYYYDDAHKPTSPMDLNIIMLFPNTQDGMWTRSWCKHPNFYGNIALERGDVVKLMYYPNIANGDLSGATDKFPKGTKLGFILKPNAWGMQKPNGNKKYYNSYKGEGVLKDGTLDIARQYNVWAASTDGLSYCNPQYIPSDKGAMAIDNPTGSSRTAKFAYRNDNNEEYAIVSFEDGCNDLDFDDVIFALKPVSAFSKLPVVENKKTENYSVYAFEDLWPAQGDYDLNDVIVELKQEKEFSKLSTETDYKIYKQSFSLTTYQNYVTLTSGLALTLETGNATPTSIVMKTVKPNSNDTISANFVKDGKVYLLTEDVKGELGTTYILEVNYEGGVANTESNMASVKPFIFRNEANGLRWEVHIPFEPGSDKMNEAYYGQDDDRSDKSQNRFFVRTGNYPFAFCLEGVDIEPFKNTLLRGRYESWLINTLYNEFLPWSISKGADNKYWYLHPSVSE